MTGSFHHVDIAHFLLSLLGETLKDPKKVENPYSRPCCTFALFEVIYHNLRMKIK